MRIAGFVNFRPVKYFVDDSNSDFDLWIATGTARVLDAGQRKKKKRDRSQALAVCKLILQYLPEFEIKKEDLHMFPEAIIADAIQVLNGSDLPPGYSESD